MPRTDRPRTDRPRTHRPSWVRAALTGALAGAVGTVAFDLVNYGLYRAGGGEDGPIAWESSAGLDSWDDAPAPAQVGRRIVEGVFHRQLPATSARPVNNAVHWSYGTSWGAQYGILARSGRAGLVRYGPLFGTVVWLSGYVVLPALKLYKPIWEYDTATLAKDLAPHLAYGTVTAAFTALGGGRS